MYTKIIHVSADHLLPYSLIKRLQQQKTVKGFYYTVDPLHHFSIISISMIPAAFIKKDDCVLFNILKHLYLALVLQCFLTLLFLN